MASSPFTSPLRSLRGVTCSQEGVKVTVVGRYRRGHPDPLRPPDPSGPSARLVLEDGPSVLLGRFGTPECLRPESELNALDGRCVRVTGRYVAAAPHVGAAPPPSAWTGGGPQIVELEEVVASDGLPGDAATQPATCSTAHSPEQTASPSGEAAPPARRTVRTPSALVRRSLALGASRIPSLAMAPVALAAGGLALVILRPVLAASSTGFGEVGAATLMAALAVLGIDSLLVRFYAGRELRRLGALAWPLDVDAYLGLLDAQPAEVQIVVRFELARPPSDPERQRVEAALGDARWVWNGPLEAELRSPRLSGRPLLAVHRLPVLGSNAPLHRWFTSRCVAGLDAAHAVAPLARVDARAAPG